MQIIKFLVIAPIEFPTDQHVEVVLQFSKQIRVHAEYFELREIDRSGFLDVDGIDVGVSFVRMKGYTEHCEQPEITSSVEWVGIIFS